MARERASRSRAKAERGALCPICFTPFLNPSPAPGSVFSRGELDMLEKNGVLNRTCLGCGGMYRIYPPGDYVSVEGFDPEGGTKTLPLKSCGRQRLRPGNRGLQRKALTNALKTFCGALRKMGYTPIEIARRLQISERRVANLLEKRRKRCASRKKS